MNGDREKVRNEKESEIKDWVTCPKCGKKAHYIPTEGGPLLGYGYIVCHHCNSSFRAKHVGKRITEDGWVYAQLYLIEEARP